MFFVIFPKKNWSGVTTSYYFSNKRDIVHFIFGEKLSLNGYEMTMSLNEISRDLVLSNVVNNVERFGY